MPLTEQEIQAIQEENAKLKQQIEDAKKTPPPVKEKENDQSIIDKVEKERKERESRDTESQKLESALRFNLSTERFLKENHAILPQDISAIFAAAEKEKYDSAIEKANATKSAVIKSFFTLQSNMDVLTSNQKLALEDYFKLTSKGREEKADEVYRNIFEPAVETIKLIKRAEELAKSKSLGATDEDQGEKAYKRRLIAGSRKHFLGEKE